MPSEESNAHTMKTTPQGRPFVKDVHDLFSTLICSLKLSVHRHLFKAYPHSFTTDEAAQNLAQLRFAQSNRTPDPKDPSRIVTTTTTTTFSMNRDMAKGVCQIFMDARLLESAPDSSQTIFKDRGVWVLTPKGLHVIERFITKNGASADHLTPVFASQPICMKLLHLERRAADDAIHISKPVIEIVFRRFVGKRPNYRSGSQEVNRADGIEIMDTPKMKHVIISKAAVDWLSDFTTVVSQEEGAEICAHFVRFGLIELLSDKSGRGSDFTVQKIKAQGSVPGVMDEAEFRCSSKCLYSITDLGRSVAKWEKEGSSGGAPSSATLSTPTSQGSHSPSPNLSAAGSPGSTTIAQRISGDAIAEREETREDDCIPTPNMKETSTVRLKQILEEPALRSLFREFLQSSFCEENVSDISSDVQDFKRRFNTTSSAAAASGSNKKGFGHSAMEKHQQDLIQLAFGIFSQYLAPASPSELNIDHNLRAELVSYFVKLKAEGSADSVTSLHASNLQTMVKLYERIQGYIFRLMATDSVPKFIKTDKFLALMTSVDEQQMISAPPAVRDSPASAEATAVSSPEEGEARAPRSMIPSALATSPPVLATVAPGASLNIP